MPFLADLDQPPRSRLPGLVLGLVLALPVAAVFVGWLVPTFVGSILGGAKDLDERLRATDAYMLTLCNAAVVPERDETLCSCVLAMEFPSLDCRAPFNEWAITQQQAACADEVVRGASVSYCTCVDTVAESVDAAPDEPERRTAAQAYENCEALEDAVPLPAARSDGS
jgi:hypothetical protein